MREIKFRVWDDEVIIVAQWCAHDSRAKTLTCSEH